jgi:uncharacterized protein (TIGR02271 family)
MAQQLVVAHFDNRAEAQRALDAVVAAGIDRASIRLLPETEAAGYTRQDTASSYDRSRDEGGFWSSLGTLFMPDEDRYAYSEGMSRGGITLSVTTDEAQASRVADILEHHGAVNMEERETAWRQEGWTGYTASPPPVAGTSSATPGKATAASDQGREGEEVIPIVEEQLRVGKRLVNRGRVRVRTYVVETPVEETVTLRDESVSVERRPVTRELADVPADAFREREIEVTETDEEAVVSKQARVVEEVVVRKDVATDNRVVRDTVRRTEVEIEDERGQSNGTAGTRRTTDRTDV